MHLGSNPDPKRFNGKLNKAVDSNEPRVCWHITKRDVKEFFLFFV